VHASAYLFQSRNGVYYARFVVPAQLRTPVESREFRISTLTKDPRDAKQRSRFLRVLVEHIWSSNHVPLRSSLVAYLQAQMTKFRKPAPGELSTFNAHKDDNGEWRFTDVKPEDIPSIDGFLETMAKHAAGSSTPLSQVAIAPTPNDAKINDPGRLAPAAKKRVSKMAAEYFKYELEREAEKEIKKKKVPQIRTRIKPFLEVYGSRLIGSLTPADIEGYRKLLVYYPMNVDKLRAAAGKTFDEIVKLSKNKMLLANDGGIAETLAETTVDGYMMVVSNFLEFCKKQYAINPTVMDGFTKKVGKAKKGIVRRAFNKEELQQIFHSEYYTDARYNCIHQYWVPHVAAFTGARINEIAQLSPDDIQKDKDNIWFIRITAAADDEEKSIKNEESRRIVPIHQTLIDLGFLEFVEAQKKAKAENLFNLNSAKADKFGKVPSEWFNQKYLRTYLEITDKTVVFHSFRHRFITSLAQAIIDGSGLSEDTVIKERIPEALVLRRIAGHSVAHSITSGRTQYDSHTDTYTGEFSIASMKKVVDKLNYEGVTFSRYQPIEPGKKRRVMKSKKSDSKITGADLAGLL
jgi:integrase